VAKGGEQSRQGYVQVAPAEGGEDLGKLVVSLSELFSLIFQGQI
jgi:hypothetical protein